MRKTKTNTEIYRTWRAIVLVVAVVFVYAAFPIATVTRWVCEGRVCGISLSMIANCCCDAPDARQRDKDCGSPRRNPARTDTIACIDGCGCKGETIRSGGEFVAGTVNAAVITEPTWAILPSAIVPPSPPVFVSATSTIHTGRGPPVRSSVPPTCSPRAPPAA